MFCITKQDNATLTFRKMNKFTNVYLNCYMFNILKTVLKQDIGSKTCTLFDRQHTSVYSNSYVELCEAKYNSII